MAKQTINIGSTANDGTGSTLRVGGDLINDNFNEIYTAFGDGSLLSNAIPGKVEGANFTNSLLVGHSTTGALNAAEFNVGIGIEALDALTSGDKNTAIGNRAMTDANTGSENVALGALSLFDLTSGSYNVGIGMLTLRYVTNSQKNTAVGYRSHESGNGSNNTALGYKSGGGSSMTGAYNTSIGYQAGLTITSGDANLSIGNQAEPLSVTGDNQLTIGTYDGTTTTTWIRGDSSGLLTITGGEVIPGKTEGTNFTNSLLVGHATTGTLSSAEKNVGIGIGALDALANGSVNTAIGYNALTSNTGGTRNTAIGSEALWNNTTGQQNVAMGHGAVGVANNSYNIGVGVGALGAATGGYNTALGHRSGHVIAAGQYNLTIGHKAGYNITTGSGNVMIGDIIADSATGDRQLKIAGHDGTNTTTWISGDNTGAVTMTLAANQITSTQLTGAVSLQILSSDGTVVKTLFGAGS
jgi:hypothetical protein